MMSNQERGSRDESVRFDAPSRDLQAEDVIQYLLDREDIESTSILCVQKTTDGVFEVAFADGSCHAVLLADPEISVRGAEVVLTKADQQFVNVRVQYLPFEVRNTQVSDEMSQFGQVFSCIDVSHSGHPSIKSGVRLLRMSVAGSIPSYVLLAGHQVRVTYRGQTPTCRRCGREGHHANVCSNVQCFRCKELGHRAADCQVPVKCFKCGRSGHTAWKCSSFVFSQEPDPVVSDSQMVVAGEVAEVIEELVASESIPSSQSTTDWGDLMVLDEVFKEQEKKDMLAKETSEKRAQEKEACERAEMEKRAQEKEACERAEMELRKKQIAEKEQLEKDELDRLRKGKKQFQQEKEKQEKQAKQDKQEKQRLREKQERFKEQEKKRVDVSGPTKESLEKWRVYCGREYVEGRVSVVLSESGAATVLCPKSVSMDRQVWINVPWGFVHQSRVGRILRREQNADGLDVVIFASGLRTILRDGGVVKVFVCPRDVLGLMKEKEVFS